LLFNFFVFSYLYIINSLFLVLKSFIFS
jgi:hypothetical protein